MRRIPDSFVDEVRRRVDIVDVVSEYVQLRRTGRNFVGLCPFHNERSPSFSVSPERQVYYCFGCQAAGTVVRFVMDIEGLGFADAVAKLASRAGLELPFAVTDADGPAAPAGRMQRLREAHELAARAYNHILMNTAAGVQALTYLEARGLTRQTIALFRLGFAPESGDVIVRTLTRRGFDTETLVASGLVVRLGDRIVDRFRGRVMIPITDAQGHVVAFGGRTLSADAKPKYLNSPDTPIFRKGAVLFNQHQARRGIRATQTAVLLEGYMDVLSAWQAGVDNAVATLGTALTAEQAAVLKRYGQRLIIAYDGDSAGLAATERAMETAEQAGLEVRAVVLPDGADPDEFIRARGGQAFVSHMRTRAMSGLEFRLWRLREAAELQTDAGRTEFLRQALELLAERATPIEQETQLKKLSAEFQVSFEALRAELLSVRRRVSRKPAPALDLAAQTPPERDMPKGYVEAGNLLLQAMLTDPDCFELVLNRGVTELALPTQTALLALLYGFRADHPNGDMLAFLDTLEDPELIRLASSLMIKEPLQFDAKVLEDYLRTIRKHQLTVARQQALRALAQAQLDHDWDAVSRWKARLDELQQDIAELTSDPMNAGWRGKGGGEL
ncbi:MAG: DNA primase [Alicyclobacillaceae bacterium]|nr:DNA primase [Alicyclobacillaceae bacterium]